MPMKHEYIDKAWVLYVVDHFGAMQTWSKEDVVGEIRRKIAETKPADVAEVEHGQNIEQGWSSLFKCSVCGCVCCDTYTCSTEIFNYCPDCGAKMDGGTTP